MRSETVVRQSPRTAARVLDGTAVVVVIDRNEMHTLNSVGTFLWDTLDAGPSSLNDLATQVAREFRVSESTALADLGEFAKSLVAAGALEIVSR